jgi:hypothetical protein
LVVDPLFDRGAATTDTFVPARNRQSAMENALAFLAKKECFTRSRCTESRRCVARTIVYDMNACDGFRQRPDARLAPFCIDTRGLDEENVRGQIVTAVGREP